ncbi:MAG: hypothetical protein GY696_20655 [Gammaproteobacteria bacterium]|nr:hypothetical protein [Gammaproteobacteria bacterium]
MVLTLTKRFKRAGLAYVALSRVISLNGLYLLHFDPESIVVDKAVLYEMNRLRQFTGLPQKPMPARSPSAPQHDPTQRMRSRRARWNQKGLAGKAKALFSERRAATDGDAEANYVAAVGAGRLSRTLPRELTELMDTIVHNMTAQQELVHPVDFEQNVLPHLKGFVAQHRRRIWRLIDYLRNNLQPMHCDNNVNLRNIDWDISSRLYPAVSDAVVPIRTTGITIIGIC